MPAWDTGQAWAGLSIEGEYLLNWKQTMAMAVVLPPESDVDPLPKCSSNCMESKASGKIYMAIWIQDCMEQPRYC
jgi:hypothetical protein